MVMIVFRFWTPVAAGRPGDGGGDIIRPRQVFIILPTSE
jgi:hypothetical protein